MVLTLVLAALAILSLALLAWQVLAASRFPLHRRNADKSHAPSVLVLKPLKGCDEHTAQCLRSWLAQDYQGGLKILFGVADESDPVCAVVRGLLHDLPGRDASLVITPASLGPNAKVSNLAQLYEHARRSAGADQSALICISDADVRVPEDFLVHSLAPLRDGNVGLVNSFYQLANPQTRAMQVEAVAVNADFWSQVLQSNMLKEQDFSLGAVMIVRTELLDRIGGFAALVDYLADDYQLGNRLAKLGARIALTPIVVDCWDPPQQWHDVWSHQVRWARTIRASQPLPYFFSILNNVTLWVTAFALSAGSLGVYRVAPGYPWHIDLLWIACCAGVWLCAVASRFVAARYLATRLAGKRAQWLTFSLPLLKDLLQVSVWSASFLGNTVVWRGRRFRILRGGKLSELK